jgi:hypothetical protein
MLPITPPFQPDDSRSESESGPASRPP